MNRVNEIRANLLLKGLSLRAWAHSHGYHYRTVHTVLTRWANRTDRKPLGGISRVIMAELLEELEKPIQTSKETLQ